MGGQDFLGILAILGTALVSWRTGTDKSAQRRLAGTQEENEDLSKRVTTLEASVKELLTANEKNESDIRKLRLWVVRNGGDPDAIINSGVQHQHAGEETRINLIKEGR